MDPPSNSCFPTPYSICTAKTYLCSVTALSSSLPAYQLYCDLKGSYIPVLISHDIDTLSYFLDPHLVGKTGLCLCCLEFVIACSRRLPMAHETTPLLIGINSLRLIGKPVHYHHTLVRHTKGSSRRTRKLNAPSLTGNKYHARSQVHKCNSNSGSGDPKEWIFSVTILAMSKIDQNAASMPARSS